MPRQTIYASVNGGATQNGAEPAFLGTRKKSPGTSGSRKGCGPERAEIGAAQAVYIPPGEIQFIENPGPGRLAFLCLVDPAWTAADEEVL